MATHTVTVTVEQEAALDWCASQQGIEEAALVQSLLEARIAALEGMN